MSEPNVYTPVAKPALVHLQTTRWRLGALIYDPVAFIYDLVALIYDSVARGQICINKFAHCVGGDCNNPLAPKP